MSRMPLAAAAATAAAVVSVLLATPFGAGHYWAADNTTDYITVWLNGALFLSSGLTLLGLIRLVGSARRGVVRFTALALALAGLCGVLLFLENGLEDAWHQRWVAQIHAYDVLLAGFLLGVMTGAVSILVAPGARRLGLGLLLIPVASVIGSALPWGSSDLRTGVSLAVGFSILAAFAWSLERTVTGPISPREA